MKRKISILFFIMFAVFLPVTVARATAVAPPISSAQPVAPAVIDRQIQVVEQALAAKRNISLYDHELNLHIANIYQGYFVLGKLYLQKGEEEPGQSAMWRAQAYRAFLQLAALEAPSHSYKLDKVFNLFQSVDCLLAHGMYSEAEDITHRLMANNVYDDNKAKIVFTQVAVWETETTGKRYGYPMRNYLSQYTLLGLALGGQGKLDAALRQHQAAVAMGQRLRNEGDAAFCLENELYHLARAYEAKGMTAAAQQIWALYDEELRNLGIEK